MPYQKRRAWAKITLDDGSVVTGEIANGDDLTDDTLSYTLPDMEVELAEIQAGNYMANFSGSGLAGLTFIMALVSSSAALLGGINKVYSFEVEELLETPEAPVPVTVVQTVEASGLLRRASLGTFTMRGSEIRPLTLEYRLRVYKLEQANLANAVWDIDIPKNIYKAYGEDIFPTFA